jgi:adenine-specific DNA-methyltransferase
MARWVMSAKPEIVLDPAAGLGNLLHACADIRDGVKLVAVERDEDTFQQAKRTAPHGTKLILADYLFAESGQFTGIIANPPYVKSQRLEYSEAEWRYFDERFGVPLDRLTNLYAIFLLKIWDDLAPGGRAAVLLPAEFMNANFGEEIKERLLNEMRPAGLVVFAPELNLFADALTTSSIIFLERGGAKDRPIKAMKASSLVAAVNFVGELLHLPRPSTICAPSIPARSG